MKIVKNNETNKYVNGDKCINFVYEFNDNEVSVSKSEINGIYPENAWCVNKKSKEIVYVIEGSGKLIKENEFIEFQENDSIIINKGEKYYWDANCKLVAVCIPKWKEKQHKIIQKN